MKGNDEYISIYSGITVRDFPSGPRPGFKGLCPISLREAERDEYERFPPPYKPRCNDL